MELSSTLVGASSSSARWKHDVFLSFRGEDTRRVFTGNLYDDLVNKGLNVYMDDQKLLIGTIIGPELLRAIEESKSAIVILSENYAGSTWCLDELAKIVECVETRELILFPVFYIVDPSDVRKQRNKFDLAKYETDSGIAKDRVGTWRSALVKVGNTKGQHVKGTDGYERDDRKEIVQMISKRLKSTLHQARGVPFPTTDVVLGETFQKNCEEVLGYLKNDQDLSIGIYGMGGVGKTTVMKHVHNQILADPTTFGPVYWFTVSQNFSIRQLQNEIFSELNLDPPRKDDEMSRARFLNDILNKMKGKYMLILDDVWEDIPFEKVGIPIGVSLCKVIVTTRSFDVLNKMECRQKIKISPLRWEEAWELFKKKLGPHEDLASEVIQIAKEMACWCDGLPLAIITMAASMKGVKGIWDWRSALEELKTPETFASNDINSKVFRVLEYSYNHLGDGESQLCFLSCALYPEDFEIPRDELIKYCIAKGLIRKMKSRRDEIDRGHTKLNKLVKCCLLECSGLGDEYVKMHDLIREMALQIMNRKQKPEEEERKQCVMVKAGLQLTRIPEEEEWTEDLEVVSLMHNKIRGIPNGMSPRCPKLSALMLQQHYFFPRTEEMEEEEEEEDWMEYIEEVSLMNNNNEEIPDVWSPTLWNKYHFTQIPNSFFVHLCDLRVLNLSGNRYLGELPDSVGKLKNLIALWLDGCFDLEHIPSLRKLKELRDLDFSRTKVQKIPGGIGELRSLRCLNMIKTYYPCSVEELRELKHLEEFRGWVQDVSDYNVIVGSEWFGKLWSYRLFLNGLEKSGPYSDFFYDYDGDENEDENEVFLHKLSLGGRGVVDVPHGIKKLVIWSCHNTGKCLLKFGLQRGDARTGKLRRIEIKGCEEVEWVVAMPSSSSPDVQLPGIEELKVEEMENMKGIFNWWEYRDSTPSIPNRVGGDDYNQSSFSKLKRLHIYRCHKMKVGLTVNCLVHLPVLEEIYIVNCSGMEEIIGGAGEDHENNNGISINTDISLPKLKSLKLEYLPSLTSIYNKGNIICDSIIQIWLKDCTKLKILPLTTTTSCSSGSPRRPFPSLSMISIERSEEEWWESLKLVHPTYHTLLRPILYIA